MNASNTFDVVVVGAGHNALMDLASPEAAALLDTLRGDTHSALPFATLLTASGFDLLVERFCSEEFWLPALSTINQRRK